MTSTDSRTRAWQFFIVLGLIGATAAVWREPRFTRPEHLVLLSLGIVAAAVAAAAMHRTLLPLVSPEQVMGDARRSSGIRALEREKRLVLRSIKELEFDKAMGKVAEPDFDDMAGRLRQRAVGLMQRIDLGEAGLRDRIAKDLAALKAAAGLEEGECPAVRAVPDPERRRRPLLQELRRCAVSRMLARAACVALVSMLSFNAPAVAQMPDLRQMNGMSLPSQDLPDGAISVRVVKQSIGNNVVGATVTVSGDGVSESASTDESGRAIFAALGPGKTLVATVTSDGETVKSQPFQVPAKGGLRVILALGLDGAAPAAASPSAPTAPAAPAVPGTVILGTQWRTILDFANEKLEVFHIFEFVNATAGPVSVPEPLKVAMPPDAEQVTLLEGSTPQARVFERQLVVAGPFASGRTVAQVAYRLPITGAGARSR